MVDLTPFGLEVNRRQRKLRARWTMEAEQDLRAFHNIDESSIVESIVSDILQHDIDESSIVESIVSDILQQRMARELPEIELTMTYSSVPYRPIDKYTKIDWRQSGF